MILVNALPIIVTERVLVPGTKMSVPCPVTDLVPTATVVVVHRDGSGRLRRVGTEAVVEGLHHASVQTALVALFGTALVTVERVEEGDARVHRVDEPPLEPDPELLAAAERSLRRYMAARSEAGEGGAVHVTLSPDPVAASHEVASHLRISWSEIQDIFEAGDAEARLRREVLVLDRETDLLRAVMGRSDR